MVKRSKMDFFKIRASFHINNNRFLLANFVCIYLNRKTNVFKNTACMDSILFRMLYFAVNRSVYMHYKFNR